MNRRAFITLLGGAAAAVAWPLAARAQQAGRAWSPLIELMLKCVP